MTIDRAFDLINNLDMRAPLRKFGPQWSTVVVSREGEVLEVIRHKEAPTMVQHREHMNMYPASVQFTTQPGVFERAEELAKRVEECVWAGRNY
jgi:hypothetical protein